VLGRLIWFWTCLHGDVSDAESLVRRYRCQRCHCSEVPALRKGITLGWLLVCNTFAHQVTDQRRLLEVTDPGGPDNDQHLVEMARRSDRISIRSAIHRTHGKSYYQAAYTWAVRTSSRTASYALRDRRQITHELTWVVRAFQVGEG
jgi:hypothetical protein